MINHRLKDDWAPTEIDIGHAHTILAMAVLFISLTIFPEIYDVHFIFDFQFKKFTHPPSILITDRKF